jgi:hypothetical protein
MMVILALICTLILLIRLARGVAIGADSLILYFGPVWWLISTLPLVVTYHSARHLYLPAAGLAIASAIGFSMFWNSSYPGWRHTSRAVAATLILVSALVLQRPLAEWNSSSAASMNMVHAIEQEANVAAASSLLILDIPARGNPAPGWIPVSYLWQWALPFAIQPPFTSTDVTARVHVVYASNIHRCAGSLWFARMHEAVTAWAARPEQSPAIILTWSPSVGALVRRSATDDPALHSQVLDLVTATTPDEMQQKLDVIVHRTAR